MTDTRYCDCDVHGPHRRAYFVCKHILRKRDPKLIARHKPWSDEPDGAGELCCSKPSEDHTVEELSLICEDTLIEIGLLKPGERRLT